MAKVPPAKSKNMSEAVSNELNGFCARILLNKSSKISQETPISRTPTKILIINLGDNSKKEFFEEKNQININPRNNPPRKCIIISKYQIEKYQ